MLTNDMSFYHGRQFVQDQFTHIDAPDPLLDCPTTVGNDLNDFIDKDAIGCDLGVP